MMMLKNLLQKIQTRSKQKGKMEETPEPKEIQPEPVLVAAPAEEDTSLVDFVDGEIARREAGEEEQIILATPAFDAQKKIATVLERSYAEINATAENPLQSIVLNSFGSLISPPILKCVQSFPNASPTELINILSTANTANRLFLEMPINGAQNATDFFMNVGKSFGSKLERMLSLNVQADETDTDLKPTETPAPTEEEYQRHFAKDFKTPNLITAQFIQTSLNGLSERLPYIQTPEDLAMLTSIELFCQNLGEAANPLIATARDPASSLEDQFKKALIIAAQKQGHLKGMDAEEALASHKRILKSKKSYAGLLVQEIQTITKTPIDYTAIVGNILDKLRGAGIYLEMNTGKIEEGEYVNFRENVSRLNRRFYIKSTEQVVRPEKDPKYTEIETTLAANESKKQKLESEGLEALATDDEIASVLPHASRLILENITLPDRGIPPDLRARANQDYFGTKKELITFLAQKMAGKEIKPLPTLDPDISPNVPGFERGETLKVTNMKGDTQAGRILDVSEYYHGAEASDLPLGSEVQLLGALNETNLVVRLNDKIFHLHPAELTKIEKGAIEIPKQLTDAVTNAEKIIYDHVIGNIKGNMRRVKEELEEMKTGWVRNGFGDGPVVIVARALGKEEGYYRDGRTKVDRHPLGRVGKVTDIDGEYLTVDIFGTNESLQIHAEEVDKLRRTNDMQLVEPKLKTAINESEGEYAKLEERLKGVISEGIGNLRAMATPNGIIGLFLGQYLAEDKLPEETRENPLRQLRGLQRKIDYSKIEKDARAAVLAEMEIFPDPEERTGTIDAANLVPELAKQLMAGYRVGKPLTEKERLTRGDLLVRTVDDGIAKGTVGKYRDECGQEHGGIHINYIGDGDRTCTTRRYHAHAERAFETPKTAEQRTTLLKQLTQQVEKAVLPIQEKYKNETQEIIRQSKEIATSLASLGMPTEQIRTIFEQNLGDTSYLRANKII